MFQNTIKVFSFITILLVLIPALAFSQVIREVPDAIDGNPVGAINKFILGDTTATGERTYPDAIYKLQRGKVYIVDSEMKIDFDLVLMADNDNPSSPTRPPMMVRAFLPDGTLQKKFFTPEEDNISLTFKNILFQSIPLDRFVPTGDDATFMDVYGANTTVRVENCIFNGWGGVIIGFNAANYKLFFYDNYFRNLTQALNPWGGNVIGSHTESADTVIFTNNTFFNVASYIYLNYMTLTNYFEFNHNTVYTSVVNSFWMPVLTNAKFTNNIVYSYVSLGQTPSQIKGGWFDWDAQVCGVASIDTMDPGILSGAGLTEADRKVAFQNNAYFWPQSLKDYWATVDSIKATVWMNERTLGMFADETGYPNLLAENNIEANPGYDAAMESAVIDSIIAFTKGFREFEWSWQGGVLRHYPSNIDQFDLPWPLPENLAYTNSALMHAGTDGFALGDLNWFPSQKADWVTAVEPENIGNSIPNKFELAQNYPNPFNPSTTIVYSIPKATHVTLSVFNALGQKVDELVNRQLGAGKYQIAYDASNLASGLYFYTIKAGDFNMTKKMMFLK